MRYASITQRLKGLGGDKWALHMEGARRAAAGKPVIFCSLGEPDFGTPQAIVDVAVDKLRAGRSKYADQQGELGFRRAVADHYSARTGRQISPAQVAFAPGTQSGLAVAMLALIDHGDEVLIPDPYYASYEGVVATPGGIVVPVPLDPDNGFHLRAEDLRARVTPRSRVVLLTSPSNPTGAVLTRDEVIAIGQVCVEHDLWMICDEVYAALTFAGNHTSPFDFAEFADRTVVVSSVSKSHAMTGWRCGWIVSSPEFIGETLTVLESLLFGSQQFLQDATAVAIATHFAECDEMREAYQARAKVVVGALDGVAGLRCRLPEGGMFVMLDVRGLTPIGEEFAWRLLDEENVVAMPGESFGAGGAGHLRISLTAQEAVLEEACRRIVAISKRWVTSPAQVDQAL
jgi:arginine:pyruvate transaminase